MLWARCFKKQEFKCKTISNPFDSCYPVTRLRFHVIVSDPGCFQGCAQHSFWGGKVQKSAKSHENDPVFRSKALRDSMNLKNLGGTCARCWSAHYIIMECVFPNSASSMIPVRNFAIILSQYQSGSAPGSAQRCDAPTYM